MRKPSSKPLDLHLPTDLVKFLASDKQLEYDPESCEPGVITLVALADLRPQRFPVEASNLEVFKRHPHYPDNNSYLVLGVNLTAECTGGYDPDGIMLWLPVERRYATWDSSHCSMQMFGKSITWNRIVRNPKVYISAQWNSRGRGAARLEKLVPWPARPYHNDQIYTPLEL